MDLVVNSPAVATADRITLQETADRLGVHYMTAYRYVRTGRLPAERDGNLWLVDPDDVARFGQSPAPTGRGRTKARAPRELVDRMVAGDEAGAWSIVEGAVSSGLDPDEVHLALLVPALRIIGDEWAAGALTVAEEHRASSIAYRLVGRLGPRFARRGRKRGTVVIGAPPGERHGLPGAIVADLLRGAGFDVFDTGPDTPAISFVESAQLADRLVAVLIGVTSAGLDDVVVSTVEALHDAGLPAPVLVGGAAIVDEAHALRLGADGWTGTDGRAVVDAVCAAADAPSGPTRT